MTFQDYFNTLNLTCDGARITDAYVLVWTPDENTPDIVYYQVSALWGTHIEDLHFQVCTYITAASSEIHCIWKGSWKRPMVQKEKHTLNWLWTKQPRFQTTCHSTQLYLPTILKTAIHVCTYIYTHPATILSEYSPEYCMSNTYMSLPMGYEPFVGKRLVPLWSLRTAKGLAHQYCFGFIHLLVFPARYSEHLLISGQGTCSPISYSEHYLISSRI